MQRQTAKEKAPGRGKAAGAKKATRENTKQANGSGAAAQAGIPWPPYGSPAATVVRWMLNHDPPWSAVPVPRGRKSPIIDEWQKLVFTLDDFHGDTNIGLKLGLLANDLNLSDADLDCVETIKLAPYFLPTTPAMWGRASKPRSHWLYNCSGVIPKKARIEFKDDKGKMLVEFRIGGGGKGAQTVFPGSVHTSGETVMWDGDGQPRDPSTVDFATTLEAVTKLAIAALVLRHWPPQGSRHDIGFALGGVLARANWELDDIANFVRAVATEAQDDEVNDRVNSAKDNYQKYHGNDPEKHVWGIPKLRELVGEPVAAVIAKYLAIDEKDVIDELNRTYAVIRVRGQVAILEETTTVDGHPDFCLMTVDHFKLWKGNQFKTIHTGENVKKISLPKYWLEHKHRRQFEGLVFRPGQDAPGYYNLWRGFAVEPKVGDCSKFLAHVHDNICAGDEAHFKWVMGWTADIFQNLREKPGTSVTLRGKQGVGKTKFGEVIGSLLAQHYFLATSSRYVTGRFNAHLVACLLLHADEAFWAGDRAAEGVLKGLITDQTHAIEFKNREPYQVENNTRLLTTGNQDWQVPAGFGERRFAVFDVAETHMKDFAYFAAIDKEMANGGREALLHYLLNYDLSSVNLREIPKTLALFEQKVASATPEQQWWLDVLGRGELPGLFEQCKCRTDALHLSYIHRTDQIGARRKSTETKLGMFLKDALGSEMKRVRHKKSSQQDDDYYFYTFPALKECRKLWEHKMQTTIAWDDPDAVWRRDPTPM
jgi:hypothetical protein